MISIHDLLESNLLDNIQAITAFDMIITMALAFGMGMFIMFIYGRIYQGAMYSGSFAVSLLALTMIATTLILAVTSNLVLSLGMMGALSIVRFRTAIKDPLEIVFLFWAIETGIVLATGILPLAVIVNIVIGCLLLVLVVRRPDYPYILVLKCEKHALKKVGEVLEKHVHYTVKSRKVETRPRAVQGRGQKPESIQDTGVPAESRNETSRVAGKSAGIALPVLMRRNLWTGWRKFREFPRRFWSHTTAPIWLKRGGDREGEKFRFSMRLSPRFSAMGTDCYNRLLRVLPLFCASRGGGAI